VASAATTVEARRRVRMKEEDAKQR